MQNIENAARVRASVKPAAARSSWRSTIAALALIAAPFAMVTGATAAPAGSSAGLQAASSTVTQVQYRRGGGGRRAGGGAWRGRGWRGGPGIGFGLAAGALAGAALARPYYGYDDGYYGGPAYGYEDDGYASPGTCYADDGRGGMIECESLE